MSKCVGNIFPECGTFSRMRILLLLIFLYQGHCSLAAYTPSAAANLRSSLFGFSFDAHVRPSDTTEVSVGLHLVSINSLDWRGQTFSGTGWFTVVWTESQVSWTPSSFDDIQNLQFYEGEIWRPDLVIENSVDDVGPVVEPHLHYRVSYMGRIVWEPKVRFTVRCAMDLTYFPFDSHVCAIVLSNWAYNASELTFSALGTTVNLDHYTENSEWELTSDPQIETSSETRVVDAETRTFSKLTFKFDLARRTDFYGLLVFLPLVLVSVLSVLVFILPLDTGQKSSYCVAILLAAILLLTVYYDNLPVARHLPVIAVYVMLVFILVTMCIICTTLVLYLYHHDPQEPMSPCMVSLAMFLAKITCSAKHDDKNTDIDDSLQIRSGNESTGSTRSNTNAMPHLHDHLPNGTALIGHALPRRKLTPIEKNRVRPKSDTSIRSNVSQKTMSYQTDTSKETETWQHVARHFNKLCLITHIILTFLVHFVFLVTLGLGGATS